MNCKNCQTKLAENDKFCTKCGAKVINHKLTFSSVAEDFFATFISWDNKFLKTLIHLYTKPKIVLIGYINGVRKRYMQPFAFLIIALTIYGIYMFFVKETINDFLDVISKQNFVKENADKQEFMQKYQSIVNTITIKYSNILMFTLIPITAIITKLIFKKFNFIEHTIILIYGNAHYLVITSTFNLIAVFIGVSYEYVSIFTIIYMILFFVYLFKQTFDLSISKIFLKSLLFFALFFVFVMVLTIAFSAIIVA